jgi:KTSC domain
MLSPKNRLLKWHEISEEFPMPSSVVTHIQYSAATSTLRIRFVSGLLYEYKNVPEKVFRAMKNASSKGTYLNRNIKGRYEFERIN